MPSHLMVQQTPPADTAESELVARAARGDEVAFEVLMRRHNQALFRTARSILRSDVEAEEAVQDALPEAFRTVFMLNAVEGLTPSDISEVLDIPVSTVRTRAYRARQLLRAGLMGQVESDLSSAFSFDGARCDRIVASVLARCRASQH